MARKHERDHLYQKAGESTWYVRIVVPADVRPAFGNRRTLTKTTGTSNKTDAMVARLPILTLWKQQIDEARARKAENADQWRESLSRSGTASQKSLSRSLIEAVQGKPSLAERKGADYLSGLLEAMEPFFNQMTTELTAAGASPETISSLLEATKKRIQASGLDSIPHIQSVHNLSNQARRQMAVNEYLLNSAEEAEARTILENPKTYKPRSPITKVMLESWAVHLETQIKTAKTRDRLKHSIQRLSDYLTVEGRPLNFDTVHRFLSTLPQARQTRANYLWAGRTFWKWANKYQQQFREQFQRQPSPFDGHDLPKTGKAAGQSWVPFTRQEVESLHANALTKGDTDLANLIVFGAFTGARLEEIGRINQSNTIFDNAGQPIGFKIEKAKSDAGVREVPIHTDLRPLYESLLHAAPANDGYLFAGGKNKYGNRLDALSKRFGRLKQKDFTELHTFHSVRKTFISELHQAGVGLELLPFIVGHETGTLTLDIYSSGPSFEQKRGAIEKLRFNFPSIE